HSSAISARSLRRMSTLSSPSNSRLRSITPSGSDEASSAASRMRFASDGLGIGQFYVNRRERFGLSDLDQQFPGELEERKQSHDQDGDAARGIEKLGELRHPLFPEVAEDAAHVLAHRELLARDVMVLGHARAVQQRAPGFRQVLGVDV